MIYLTRREFMKAIFGGLFTIIFKRLKIKKPKKQKPVKKKWGFSDHPFYLKDEKHETLPRN